MEYKELDKEFNNLLDKFDMENRFAIEEAHTPLLNKYAEVGFGIGFTHAFKILTACYGKTG
jgi:hypothetical protein